MTTSSPSAVGPGVVPPRATYRLQLNKDFTFADAAAQAGYLGALGVSHVYLSPILKARAGSTHGYDTVDHTVLNSELGTLEGFREMARAFRNAGLGIVLDIVPNHMGVGGHENALWLDVLEWGEESQYANWFDINWMPAEPSLHHKILVPLLGTSYGEALSAGDLLPRFDAEGGGFAIWNGGTHKLPLSLASYPLLIGGIAGLETITERCKALSSASEGEGLQTVSALKCELARLCAEGTPARHELDRRLAYLGSAAGIDDLDRLIGRQHWRAARYSVAADDINYRRFFIVSDLAGVRIERDEVFEHVHRLTFQLVEEGWIDGLRVDHIDGLFDPAGYCRKLRERCPKPVYLVVEKIVASDELLPAVWEVDGTTGYEFASETMQLITDPAGEAALTAGYVAFTGDRASVAEVERAAKLSIMEFEMAAEVDALAGRLHALAVERRETRDLTSTALGLGLKQFVASLPVYRTYVDGDGATAGDRAIIAAAIEVARREAPTIDPAVFDFLECVACGSGTEARGVAQRIQQLSGPVMAKGLEDTALYRCNRLLSAADVGQRPDKFSLSVAAYHAMTAKRAAAYPQSMLGTSSHDSKRGEDARARIAVLSGLAREWQREVAEWTRLLAEMGAPEIDRNDPYTLFQLLLGAWPTEFAPGTVLETAELERFRERLTRAMTKGLREARLRSTWVLPDEAYECAVRQVIGTMLAAGENRFLARFRVFEAVIGPLGAQNGLVLTTLKLTLPGVPDIYQGAEFWEQSMVDPDNRRPVDFAVRAAALGDEPPLVELMDAWRDGRVKQGLIRSLLALRAERPKLFAAGSYVPIALGDEVLAFEREHGGDVMRVAVRLFPWRSAAQAALAPLASEWRVVVGETASDTAGQLVADFSRAPMLVAVRR